MILLACSPLSVGFGRSSICLKVEEEVIAPNAQSAQRCQRSLVPHLAKRLPVFSEALVLALRLWGQVQGFSPGLLLLMQCGVFLSQGVGHPS